jgi:hypothetical protein
MCVNMTGTDKKKTLCYWKITNTTLFQKCKEEEEMWELEISGPMVYHDVDGDDEQQNVCAWDARNSFILIT